MGILNKVKNLVSGEEGAEETKKPRAKKAAASDTTETPKKRASKKAVATEAAHDHGSHEGHDHAPGEGHGAASKQVRPESVVGAVGVGAARHIVRALITEKGTIAGLFNTYLFQVAIEANKSAIKQAIEKLYAVKVTKVHTLRQDGKVVRYGRISGRRSNFKKAYVSVAKGQTITIHKGV